MAALAALVWSGAGWGERPIRLHAGSPNVTPAPAGTATIYDPGRTPPNPFVGSWSGTDPVDGSEIHVTIPEDPPSAAPDVRWREDAFNACGGDRGRLEANGERSGEDTLRLFDATITCLKTGQTVPLPDNFGFIYSPDSDTIAFWFIEDDEPVFAVIPCFHRTGKPGTCP